MIAPGTRIGHYLIEKRLGAGGMGEVFRAFDESLDRPVAIKVLPQIMERNQEARARMLREARAASALVHPGIVTVHEVGEHDGSIFLVMELVVGETFTQLLIRRGKLPPGEALKLVRPVAAALEFAHKAGFVHRDIKCSNLMVSGSGHVKVLDFGLSKRMRREPTADAPPAADAPPDTVGMRKGVAARLAAAGGEVAAAPADAATRPGSGVLGGRPPSMPSHDVDATGPTVASLQRKQPSNDDLTMVGAALGTPGYSALELMDGLEADGRADVFSLGVVLYELLTAARPFSGATWGDVRNEVAAERYRRAREHVPSLSSELDAVIEQALRANRDVRTPSVGALVAALAHASAAPRRRRRALMVIGAAAAVSGGAWGLLRYTGKARTSTAPVADAAVAVPGPDLADASTDDGDASAVDTRAAVQLTQTDGCAYAPAFLDDDRVAFELTLPGTAPDIHVRSLASGTTSHLTREPTDEWRAGPGLVADELIYLVTDHANPTRSSLVARDLSTGAQRELAPRAIAAAAAARGAYYFVPASGTELRRMRNKIDEQVARLPGMSPQSLTKSPDDRWLALVGPTPSQASDVCLFDLERRALRCANRTDALAGRADFGAGGALYYGARDGIHARLPADGPATADRLVIPSVLAHGGLAIAPGGQTLVYSECHARSVLRDVGATPAVSLTDDDQVASPAAGPGGRIAWVNAGGELFVRFPDGELRPVTGPATPGTTVADPAFDAAGEHLVFARSGQEAGIATVEVREGAIPVTLTRQPGDSTPLYLKDGSVVFTRVAGATPHVYRIAAGADPALARAAPRRTVDVDRATGRVLLRAPDTGALSWWDPIADTEVPGPPADVPGVAGVSDHSISPDGRWLLYQAGAGGRELWRTALPSALDVPLERVYVAPVGATVSRSAITDEGHALIAEDSRRGDLYRLDAGATPW